MAMYGIHVVMPGLVLLVATWNPWISCRTYMQDCGSFLFCFSWTIVNHLGSSSTLSLFYRYYFGRCSSELAQLVLLPYSQGRSSHYSDRLHDFSFTILRCYKNVYVNSFFPRTARLWNSLPIECFPLTYDLSGFKSRINRHLLIVGSFLTEIPVFFNLFVLFFSCNSMPHSGCSILHGVNPNLKNPLEMFLGYLGEWAFCIFPRLYWIMWFSLILFGILVDVIYNIQFKPSVTCKMELFVKMAGNCCWLLLHKTLS